MRARSVRRRRYKGMARNNGSHRTWRDAEGVRQLLSCQGEAQRRAPSLTRSAVWDPSSDERIPAIAVALDSEGGVQEHLGPVCAKMSANGSGCFLVLGSRPAADRARLQK